MNSTFIAVALLLLLTTFPPVALGQKECSCNAPDNSCSAAVLCRDGGAAICSSKNACHASCAGSNPDKIFRRISLKIEKKTGDQVAAELSRQSDRHIIFAPKRRTDLFTFELINQPLWTILDFLNGRGQVFLDGTPFKRYKELRRALSRGEKVSLRFTDSTAGNAVSRLAFLSGLPLRVESGDAGRPLSMSLEKVTLDEIIARISAETGVRIDRASTK
jgi:hypothetical protein